MSNEATIQYGTPGQFKIPIPKALALAIDLKKGEKVVWKIVTKNKLQVIRKGGESY